MSVHLAYFSDYLPNFVFYSPPSPSSAAGTSLHDVGDPFCPLFQNTISRNRPPQNIFWLNSFLLVFFNPPCVSGTPNNLFPTPVYLHYAGIIFFFLKFLHWYLFITSWGLVREGRVIIPCLTPHINPANSLFKIFLAASQLTVAPRLSKPYLAWAAS